MTRMNKKTIKKTKEKIIPVSSSFFSARLSSIIAIILLLGTIGVLYAKKQELEKSQREQKSLPTSSPTPVNLVAPTTQPEQPIKQKTNIIKDTALPTPSPTERKKVPITLTDPTVAGTYYCYEDKANEIMTTQNNLNLAIKTLEICGTTLSFNIKTCFDDCTQKAQACINNCYGSGDMLACTYACDAPNKTCGDACPKGTECSDKYLGDIDRLRSQLQQLKASYCP